jgi:uncharacterized membrane protein required for colicin V production
MMRKRGFIILVATIPTWIAAIVLGNAFYKEISELRFIDAEPPVFLLGVRDAAMIGTLVGLFLVLIDLNSWFKKRNKNEGVGQAN